MAFCWKNHQRYCPRCKERKLYTLSPDKRRCTRCNYTFHDFSQRFINGCGFDFQQWLWFLKLFELEIPNQELALQLKVSYATILKAKDVLRRAILAQAMDADSYYTLGMWPGPGRPRPQRNLTHPPVFGVMEINGYIICDVLPEFTPETLLHFKMNFHLRTASIGHVVYTAPFQQYKLLLCCGRQLTPAGYINHDATRLPADSLDFWVYAKQRLKRLRGVAPDKFPLHLKEWELRYNQRQEDLISVLAGSLCGFVPDCKAQPS